jgi:acetyltransferase-like isoleucine patch superfamily enzyme
VEQGAYFGNGKDIKVGDYVEIGAFADAFATRQDNDPSVIIGASSVVTKDIPDYAIVGGNPPWVLKSRRG